MIDEKTSQAILADKFSKYPNEMRDELLLANNTEDVQKDIIIVIKDQYEYIKNCVDSLYANTANFRLFLWDNASQPETADYLRKVAETHENVHLHRSEVNTGFLPPNNELAKLTTAPYIILLNSDTEVRKGWDKAMIGWLQRNPDCLEVGYSGSRLNAEMKGGPLFFGWDIDYIPGWSVCISRETYNRFGLFDGEHLDFAYCEDSDLSLRIQEAGFRIYALHVDLVLHFENRTVNKEVQNESFKQRFAEIFEKNHKYMRQRWGGKGLTHFERNLANPSL